MSGLWEWIGSVCLFGFTLFWMMRMETEYRRSENEILRSILAKCKVDHSRRHYLLFIDYRDPGFGDIDRSLHEKDTREIIVFLSAPPWLIQIKQTKWANHRIVDMSLIDAGTSTRPTNQLMIWNHGRLVERIPQISVWLSMNMQA